MRKKVGRAIAVGIFLTFLAFANATFADGEIFFGLGLQPSPSTLAAQAALGLQREILASLEQEPRCDRLTRDAPLTPPRCPDWQKEYDDFQGSPKLGKRPRSPTLSGISNIKSFPPLFLMEVGLFKPSFNIGMGKNSIQHLRRGIDEQVMDLDTYTHLMAAVCLSKA